MHPLADPFTQVTVQNHYCETGSNISVTTPLSLFTGVEPGVELKLCHGNNYNICSDLVAVAPVPTPTPTPVPPTPTPTSTPTPTPLTGKIVFYSGRFGSGNIHVVDADGSNEIRLTSAGQNVWPDWSPDGAKVAFSSNRDGSREMYLMNSDGSNQTRLANTETDIRDPTWSPNGDRIAFAHLDVGSLESNPFQWEIYVIDSDGSNRTRLTDDPRDDFSPTWSSDGGEIAFHSNGNAGAGVYVMNVDGTNQRKLASAAQSYPDWSLDGNRIAFVDGNEIYVMNADGSGQTQLTNNSAIDGYPAWSPDGTRIVFSSNRDGNYEIYIMNADGTNQTRLTDDPDFDGYPDWEP